ncbi:MAG: S8 family peptidase [Bacteroidetes bacterium]|nr:S8 family peptidase [Bacteroidota bacterium]
MRHINAKQRTSLFTLLFFSWLSIFAQNTEVSDKIILQLKSEIGNLSETSLEQNMVGNNKIDSINLKFHSVIVKKQLVGKKTLNCIYVIQFPIKTNLQKVIDQYYRTKEVEYAEIDQIGYGGGQKSINPNDSYYKRQWALKNDGTFTLSTAKSGADINIENAWSIEQGDSNIIVAVIDGGAKLDHAEFKKRIWKNYSEIPGNGKDDDGNGYIDDLQGWNFAYNNNDPSDDFGHGTNVAGIIGANGNNSIGYAGVDWNCKLMILKGLNKTNFGFYSWWADAIYYAVDNGARVINMSLGGTATSTTLQNAVEYALKHNVTVVVCMMNTNSNTVYYPAAFSGVIAVGSTNSDDTRSNPFFWSSSSGSNYGDYISVVAPGNYIYGLDYQSNTNYNSYWGGTSQATPLVSGLVSLLLAQDTSRGPSQIKSIIESSAIDQVGDANEDKKGWDKYYGHGRIDAFKALSFQVGINNPDLGSQKFFVFPNPTSQNFTIKGSFKIRRIQVFNSIGEMVMTKEVEAQESVTVELLENGIFFIKIITPEQSVMKKIIVQRD